MVWGVSSTRSARDRPPAPEPLAPLIDAHTHLDACGAETAQDVTAILDRAAAVGVRAVVTIADDLDAARWAAHAADWDPRVYAAVALHPTRAGSLDDAARVELEALAARERVVAIGETGMDMYWPGKLDGCAEPAVQRDAFAWHIDLAKRTGKPLMIHNREADAEVLDVLAAEGAPETVIFHCFSSDAAMARTCVGNGWLLSLSGTVSFRNAHALREAAAVIPPELLLVETDSPYLAPVPRRGRPNRPANVAHTLRFVADLRGMTEAELDDLTSANAARVFGW